MKIVIKSLEELSNFTNKLTYLIKKNTVINLVGNMGVGKTTFVKSLLKNLNIKCTVNSPTFFILKQYKIDNLVINHYDFYRLSYKNKVENKFDFLQPLRELAFESSNIIEWVKYDPKSMFWLNNPYFKIITVKITELINGWRRIKIF